MPDKVEKLTHPVWNSLPTALWVALILVIVLIFRSDLRAIIASIIRRLRLGAPLKVWNLEIGASYVEPDSARIRGGDIRAVRKDNDEKRWQQRKQYYKPNRNLQLVHRLAPSDKPGHVYDILIYLVPHYDSDATLAGVKKVEYYFGKSWGNSIFTSTDRARGFAISTSAWGAFMCTAEIYFSDGEQVMVNRYIDFEMGPLGPSEQSKAKE